MFLKRSSVTKGISEGMYDIQRKKYNYRKHEEKCFEKDKGNKIFCTRTIFYGLI